MLGIEPRAAGLSYQYSTTELQPLCSHKPSHFLKKIIPREEGGRKREEEEEEEEEKGGGRREEEGGRGRKREEEGGRGRKREEEEVLSLGMAFVACL